MPAIAAEAAEAALKKKQMIFIERLGAGKFTLVHHSEGRFTPMIYWQLWVCKGKKEGERGERREERGWFSVKFGVVLQLQTGLLIATFSI